MPAESTHPSARQVELLESAYAYVLQHGLVGLSLRPLASAIGSSPRVLIFLFGSKDGLVQALLARARCDELALLEELRGPGRGEPIGLRAAAELVWDWLAADLHRPLLRLWVEAYARSLIEIDGPWSGFARATVEDWLDVLASSQPEPDRSSPAGLLRRTAALAVLRGGLLDVLATSEDDRVDGAVRQQLRLLDWATTDPQ